MSRRAVLGPAAGHCRRPLPPSPAPPPLPPSAQRPAFCNKSCNCPRRLLLTQALPAEALSAPAAPAPSSPERRGVEVSRPSQRRSVELVASLSEATSAADLSAAICGLSCQPVLPQYPTSVKVLLRELRERTDDLRRTRYELEATQKLLYSSEAQVEDIREAKWQELGAVTVSCLGLTLGLRSYLGAALSKVHCSSVLCASLCHRCLAGG